MNHVIIGAGAAGISAAQAIKNLSTNDEIIMVSNDPAGFYSRPGLAYFLSGEINKTELFPDLQRKWIEKNVRFISGDLTKILPSNHTIVLSDNRIINYDRLLLSIGSEAMSLNIPGSNLEAVVKLDDFEDSKRIIKLSRKAREAVVIGGGITALELVEGLLARNVKVHFLIRGDRFWRNVLDEEESKLVLERLVSDGVQTHYHAEAKEIISNKGKVSALVTNQGEKIKCQLVAYAVGIQPRIKVPMEAGVNVDRGILVDEYMRTNLSDIYSAGDAAQVFDPFSGRYILDSLWYPARKQGQVAGCNMVGESIKYVKELSFNVTRLAGITTSIIGMVGSRSSMENLPVTIVRGDSETFHDLPDSITIDSGSGQNNIRLIIGERTLLGALLMGDQTLSSPLKELITKQIDISRIRDDLLNQEIPITDNLLVFWSQSQSEKD